MTIAWDNWKLFSEAMTKYLLYARIDSKTEDRLKYRIRKEKAKLNLKFNSISSSTDIFMQKQPMYAQAEKQARASITHKMHLSGVAVPPMLNGFFPTTNLRLTFADKRDHEFLEEFLTQTIESTDSAMKGLLVMSHELDEIKRKKREIDERFRKDFRSRAAEYTFVLMKSYATDVEPYFLEFQEVMLEHLFVSC